MAVYQRQSSKEYQLGRTKGAIKGGGRCNSITEWLALFLYSISWNEPELFGDSKPRCWCPQLWLVAGGQGMYETHTYTYVFSMFVKLANLQVIKPK